MVGLAYQRKIEGRGFCWGTSLVEWCWRCHIWHPQSNYAFNMAQCQWSLHLSRYENINYWSVDQVQDGWYLLLVRCSSDSIRYLCRKIRYKIWCWIIRWNMTNMRCLSDMYQMSRRYWPICIYKDVVNRSVKCAILMQTFLWIVKLIQFYRKKVISYIEPKKKNFRKKTFIDLHICSNFQKKSNDVPLLAEKKIHTTLLWCM